MSLDSNIRHLLYDHDCVIIPSFGGFLTQYRSAHINSLKGIVHPPSKVLAFNRRLNSNDGLLAHEMMRQDALSYDEAMAIIEVRVSNLEAGLKTDKRAELDGIGVIYRDDEDNYRFAPAQGLNFLKDSFGLESLALPQPASKPVEVVKSAEQPVIAEDVIDTPVVVMTPESTPEIEEKSPEKKSRPLLRVAAIVIPLALVGTAWLMRDQLPINAASLGISPGTPEVVKTEFQPRIEEEDIRLDYPSEEDRIASIAASNPALSSIYFDFTENEMNPNGVKVILKEDARDIPASVETTPVSTVNDRLSHRFFIVGGAFSKEGNAKRLVRKLEGKGYDAYIFGKRKGLFMVCYGGYSVESEARTALDRVRTQENSKAWFKRK